MGLVIVLCDTFLVLTEHMLRHLFGRANVLHLGGVDAHGPLHAMFGGEFMYADREVESGADGDLTRFQFSAKYAF